MTANQKCSWYVDSQYGSKQPSSQYNLEVELNQRLRPFSDEAKRNPDHQILSFIKIE